MGAMLGACSSLVNKRCVFDSPFVVAGLQTRAFSPFAFVAPGLPAAACPPQAGQAASRFVRPLASLPRSSASSVVAGLQTRAFSLVTAAGPHPSVSAFRVCTYTASSLKRSKEKP